MYCRQVYNWCIRLQCCCAFVAIVGPFTSSDPITLTHSCLRAKCAGANIRQHHAPDGSVTLSVDAIVQSTSAKQTGVLSVAFPKSNGSDAHQDVSLGAPGQNTVSMKVSFSYSRLRCSAAVRPATGAVCLKPLQASCWQILQSGD